MKALFIGRFQPLHKGHLGVITDLLKNHEEVIIGIGCCNTCNEKNPFCFEEVAQMINESIKGNYKIIKIDDCANDTEWVNKIKEAIGKDYEVYSGNEWVEDLFKKEGVAVKQLDRTEGGLSATQVRELIKKNDNSWINLVPEGTISVINRIGGADRIKKISKVVL